MTLDTRIAILDPTDARDLFDRCRTLIGATDHHRWEHTIAGGSGNRSYRMLPGQGLPARLIVSYGADGPIRRNSDDPEMDDYYRQAGAPMEYAVEVSFDTAYSYRDEYGGCGNLHARYVQVIGRWCEERGLEYRWENEFTGEWHADWRLANAELGRGEAGAAAWMKNVVEPAILAAFAGEGRS